MKPLYTLTFFICLISFKAFSQDTVKVDNSHYSIFEKLRNQPGKAVSEDATELLKVKNLRISTVLLLKNNQDTISKAIKFDIRGADLKMHIIPYRLISYLDADEIPAFIQSIQSLLQKRNERPYYNEKNISFSSRGGVNAACYMKNNTWKVAVSTDPANMDAYTFLKKQHLQTLISSLSTVSW